MTNIELNRRQAVTSLSACFFGALCTSTVKASKDNAGNLENLNKQLDKIQIGTTVLAGLALTKALAGPSKTWAIAAEHLIDLAGKFDAFNRAVSEVIDIKNDELRDKEGREIKTKVNKASNECDSDLSELIKSIKAIPVGIISEKSSKEFEVSLDLLLDNEPEAMRRFGKLARTMESFIAISNKNLKTLKSIETIGQSTSRSLNILYETLLELAPYLGHALGQEIIFQALDIEKLKKECNKVRGLASKKIEQIKYALSREEEALDCLVTNVKTFWGKDL